MCVVAAVMKSLEVRVFPAVPVDTAEVRGTVSVLITLDQLLLPHTDAPEDLSPGVVAVTVSVPSVSSLALSQRDAVGSSPAGSDRSRVIFPGKAHVHEATMIQASFARHILTVNILDTYGIHGDVSEHSESLIRGEGLVV